ncbi:truncated membrane protein ORF26 [Cyprinid herpesvirus 3]|uniref:ORF26R n=1 Tax=Cyprinid herpesvirus 3 TaxID=180230 RepID=H8PF53_CYHV3|nr:unnamed protein product [Cyprinid herpesvirus 3]AFD97198.1 truncated membrane protein ORF26 [Cyprinid herpesvirus 3]AIC32381.1 ORF26R [Cyprinid herpesvirus 3]AOO32433.1 truncated membrane protein ORF26 [Cyprinid herpesvirus 3]AOO32592.1 truncated membrane protein ORF26 [Cyprinid herpesvirus 3]AOO32749.1 truncated membrane protein ORF26 [Cyprinid herpesvirus 3]
MFAGHSNSLRRTAVGLALGLALLACMVQVSDAFYSITYHLPRRGPKLYHEGDLLHR